MGLFEVRTQILEYFGQKLGENLGKLGKNGRKSDGNEMKIGGEIWGEMGKNW